MTITNFKGPRYNGRVDTCTRGCCAGVHGFYITSCKRPVRENLKNGKKAHA